MPLTKSDIEAIAKRFKLSTDGTREELVQRIQSFLGKGGKEAPEALKGYMRRRGYVAAQVRQMLAHSDDSEYWKDMYQKYNSLGGNVDAKTGATARTPWAGPAPKWTKAPK